MRSQWILDAFILSNLLLIALISTAMLLTGNRYWLWEFWLLRLSAIGSVGSLVALLAMSVRSRRRSDRYQTTGVDLLDTGDSSSGTLIRVRPPYGKHAHVMFKCACGAINIPPNPTGKCWDCGRPFKLDYQGKYRKDL